MNKTLFIGGTFFLKNASGEVNNTSYHGIITADPENENICVGMTFDGEWGIAALSNIAVTDVTVSFDRQYVHRDEIMRCTFYKKDGNVWIGKYEVRDKKISPETVMLSGTAKCVLTEVDSETFFAAPEELQSIT